MSTNVMTGMTERPKLGVRSIAQIGMLGAAAAALMFFEVPLPFSPSFYLLDFSEIPVLIGCFAMGPFTGAAVEFIKILLHLFLKGTITAGVGEIANFLIGCAFVIPAGLIYQRKRTRGRAIAGMAAGTAFMTIAGCVLNAFVLLPAYAKAFEMPLDGLISMGTAVNGRITSLFGLVLFAVAPFNLVKGFLVSLVVFLIYKKLSPVFRMNR